MLCLFFVNALNKTRFPCFGVCVPLFFCTHIIGGVWKKRSTFVKEYEWVLSCEMVYEKYLSLCSPIIYTKDTYIYDR